MVGIVRSYTWQMMKLEPEHEVLIVGSGFAGLCMGVRLRQAGIADFLILEKDAEFGGTWWANSYPGCAVDIPSHLYSFSFARYVGWSRRFAPRAELLAYTRAVAQDFGLAPHIRVSTAFLGARFDEAAGCWIVQTSRGETSARCIVSALGALNRAAIPALPGLAQFQGPVFHSSLWDHLVDLRGKRVAVVGTGASAIQFVPEIVDQVAHLDLYQRTAPWILPRPDRAIGPAEQARLARSAALRLLYRGANYVQYESRALLYAYFPRLFRVAQALALRHLHRQVADPALRRALTPDYTMGCKRVLLANSYYPALARPNVSLVAGGAQAVRGGGVVDAQGQERPADVIIFGTGFDVEHTMGAVDVVGRDGKRLMQDDLAAYKGCTVAGFPNYFMITGPNTGLGHNSIIYMIESGAAYALDAIRMIRERKLHSVDVKAEVQARYNAALQKRLARGVWSTGCKSWYLDEKGRNYTIWPGFSFLYRWITRRFDIQNYHVK